MAKGISLFFFPAPSAPRRIFRLFSENQTSPKTLSLPAEIAVIHSSGCLCLKTIQKHQMQLPTCLMMFYSGTTLHLLSSVCTGSQVFVKEPALAARLLETCMARLGAEGFLPCSWGPQWVVGWRRTWVTRCWCCSLWSLLCNQMEHPPEGSRSPLL